MSLTSPQSGPVISLEEFEGPLELLLTLVERRRLPIAELSLVTIADQYLAYVRALTSVEANVLSEFLAIGSRLLLLKSRALLPILDLPTESGDETDEPSPDELVRSLEAYRAFREVAAKLATITALGNAAYAGGARSLEIADAAPTLVGIAPAMLAGLMVAINGRQGVTSVESAPIVRRATVAERLQLLRSILGESRTVAWDDVAGISVDEIVATLLAVLELVRRGELSVVQPDLFGPIRLEALDHAPIPIGGDA